MICIFSYLSKLRQKLYHAENLDLRILTGYGHGAWSPEPQGNKIYQSVNSLYIQHRNKTLKFQNSNSNNFLSLRNPG